MGTLTLELIVSADGFAAEPDGGMRFVEAVPFDDRDHTDEHQLAFVDTVGAILLGRRTYEMFASYWPTASVEQDRLAGPINALPKLVLSATLQSAPWGDGECEVVRGGVDAVPGILKRFGSIVVWGSLSLARELLSRGLVDQIRLRSVPVLIGDGLSFAPTTLDPQVMQLVETHRYPTGHVTTVYDVH